LAPFLWNTDPSPLQRPVISVGNIAVGGRGKTPLVALVARILLAAGERPAILTRGYKRRRALDGVVVVSDGSRVVAALDESGDEPLMLAESLPGVRVLVCDVRAMAGAVAERALDATVHILDDGFQHRALARDIDLVVVAPADLEGARFPFGRLRESPRAIARADAVIADGAPDGPWALPVKPRPGNHQPRTFKLHRKLGAIRDLDGSPTSIDQSATVLAVAGIANPDRFRASLTAAGWNVSGFLPFADHHRYTASDIAKMAAEARAAGAAAIVTTDKDAVRLRGLGPFPVPVAVAPLEVTLEPFAQFQNWLLDRVRSAREGRAR
jgi:tetraacyldisaccharide 4'-kinase